MTDLLPCPFCSNDVEVKWRPPPATNMTGSCQVSCKECKTFRPGWYGGEEECIQNATEQWNTRAPQQQWISVKDRLPKEGQLVLVYSACLMPWNGDRPLALGEFSPHGGEHFRAAGLNLDLKDIDGWQPLPSPLSLLSPDSEVKYIVDDKVVATKNLGDKDPETLKEVKRKIKEARNKK